MASHGSGRVNYIVEHASPSVVCLIRKVQNSPYQSLSAEQVQSVAVPNYLSLRPPPHVAHQAVMDFYFAINGHCGVRCADPAAIDLITVSAHTRDAPPRTRSQQKQNATPQRSDGAVGNNTSTGSSSTNNSYNNNNNNNKNSNNGALVGNSVSGSAVAPNAFIGNETAAQQTPPHVGTANSLLGAPVTSSSASSASEDYRLSQIRRNERHVNNAVYGKVCTYFNTREGCRRGPYCNFLHVGKTGAPHFSSS